MDDFVETLADPDLGPALFTSIMGLLLGILLLILVHEGGHALFGRLAGYRVRFIRIGRGPTLFRFHIGLAGSRRSSPPIPVVQRSPAPRDVTMPDR